MGWASTERAMMTALCYPFLVSLALAAPGVSRRCYDYCKSLSSEAMNGVPPLECYCEDFIDTDIDSTEASITLDDTGVYFVPAEVQLFQQRFASQPFYISNPAKLYRKSRTNTINRESDDASKDAFDDPIPSPSEQVEIFERTETISHTSINREKHPVYLDIEIEKSTDNESSATRKGTLIEDVEATERALVECLDFQVLHYSRIYGFMKEFKKFWEVRNLSKYEDLSNLDIEEKINKYCNETESILEQNIYEIKQGLPKRGHDSEAVAENEDIVSGIHSMKDSVTEENPTSQMTLYPLSENFTQLSETNAKTTDNNAATKNFTDIYGTTYDPMESWPFVHITPSPITTDGVNDMNRSSSPFTDAVTGITIVTTESTPIVHSQAKFRNADHKSNGTTARETELDLGTMGSEDVSTIYMPTYIAQSKTTNDSQFSDHKTILSPISTTTFSIDESLVKESATTEVNTINSETLNEFNTLSYDTSQISVTGAYSQDRNIYDEKEVKIPKIVTKECSNNTVQSNVYGTEELPNNDFIDQTTVQAGDFKTRRRAGVREYDITGKLYFVAKNELVPVRFIQTDTGAVSLGIDGVSLCNKLVPITNKKYSLLATLCDYVQNNLDHNKTIV